MSIRCKGLQKCKGLHRTLREETITIQNVAELAGVSVATVSRVINGIQNVRNDTKEKVLAAMEELNYSPNASARNLRKQESKAVLVLTPNFSNPFHSHILDGISERAQMLGYSALIVPYKTEENAEMQMKDMIDSKKADGAILLASGRTEKWLKKYEKDYCIVQCAEYSEQVTRVPHVSINNYKAMFQMTKYLQSLGHKEIAIVLNDNKFVSTNLRLDGYLDAMKENGIVDCERLIYRGKNYNFETGIEAINDLMNREIKPTAVMCISDILALGVINGANSMGLQVPDELSVTGFDDVDYTKMIHPYLTTIKQPCYDLGTRSMDLLYNKLQGINCEAEVYLSYELKIRESTSQI